MPKASTIRRHNLTKLIDQFGEEMVQKCSTCVRHNRVCRVHVKSGRCGECNRRNQRCDVRVTQSEFRRLISEKEKLRKGIDEALASQEKLLESLRTARAKEQRLRQQMDLLDSKAAEAIAVEERSIQELEQEEAQEISFPEDPSLLSGPQLGTGTWSALEGVPESFWDDLLNDPGDNGVAASGS